MCWIGRKLIKLSLFVLVSALFAKEDQYMWDLGMKVLSHKTKPINTPTQPTKTNDFKAQSTHNQQKLSIAPPHLENTKKNLFTKMKRNEENQFLLSLKSKTTAEIFAAGKNKILSNKLVEAKEAFYYLLNTQTLSESQKNQTKFYYAYSQFLDGNHFQALKILESIEPSQAKSVFLTAQALERLNKKQEALNNYLQILNRFPKSDYYNIAKLKIGELE